MAMDGEQVQTANTRRLFREKPDFFELVLNAASEAYSMLNSEACFSGAYKAVLVNSAFAELFGAFLPAFYMVTVSVRIIKRVYPAAIPICISRPGKEISKNSLKIWMRAF